MKDVQNERDERNITIDKVGVKNIAYPIIVADRAREKQNTVARVNMYVDLPHLFKGTHMSRFIEILHGYRGEISLDNMAEILSEMKNRLGAESAHMEVQFPYFVMRKAPVTESEGFMDFNCEYHGHSDPAGNDYVLIVHIPVTSVCPCSKEISRYGAHNQRSIVSISVRTGRKFIWIEELIEIADACSSSAVYSVLKREDERFVTEHAYDNPVFVEDIVRGVAQRLKAEQRVVWFRVEADNQESIHNHSAYACIEWRRP